MAGPQGSTETEEPDDAESPLADNPPGFVNPGQGINDLAGKDHALRLAAMRREQFQERKAALSSGGFKLDAEAMRELQSDWEDLTRELQELANRCFRLGYADPPAEEKASIKQIKAVYKHAQVCATIHDQMFQYSYQYATRLGDAVSKVGQSDETAQQSLNEVGNNL